MKNIVYDFTNSIFVIIERSIYSNWIYHTVIYHHRIAEILYTTIVNWFLICNIFNDYIVFLYIVLNALGFWETLMEKSLLLVAWKYFDLIFQSSFDSNRGSGWEEIERNFEENDVWKGNFCRGKSEMSEVEKQSRSRHVTGCGVER